MTFCLIETIPFFFNTFMVVIFLNLTDMSEKIDPEEVHQIMDGCFKTLMDEIHEHQGTINQFTGDGVMALFGAPLALEGHAQDACRAALSIQNELKSYSKDIEKKFGIKFQMRIGINSGPVVVGSIGDTTNLVAGMESMAESGTVLLVRPGSANPGSWQN